MALEISVNCPRCQGSMLSLEDEARSIYQIIERLRLRTCELCRHKCDRTNPVAITAHCSYANHDVDLPSEDMILSLHELQKRGCCFDCACELGERKADMESGRRLLEGVIALLQSVIEKLSGIDDERLISMQPAEYHPTGIYGLAAPLQMATDIWLASDQPSAPASPSS